MKVVRGRLAFQDTQPQNARYNSDCECTQTTADGGATWVDDPTVDPRHALQFLKPPLTTSDPQCDAAANMVKYIKDFIDGVVTALSEGASGLTIATAAVTVFSLLFFEVGLLVDLFLALGAGLASLGSTALDDAFDSSVYDELKCFFLCAADAEGKVSPTSFSVLQTQIAASGINSTAKTVIGLMLTLMGEVGLTNAGAIGSETGDCSDCDPCGWVKEWDVSNGDTLGWQIVLVADGTPRGSYVGGRFIGTHQGGSVCLTLMYPMAGIHVNGAAVYIESFHGTGIGNVHRTFDFTDMTNPGVAATVEETDAMVSISPAQWQHASSADFTCTEGFGMDWICDSNDTGRSNVYKIRVSGVGEPPSGGVFVDSLP